jgi:Zn-dependent protease
MTSIASKYRLSAREMASFLLALLGLVLAFAAAWRTNESLLSDLLVVLSFLGPALILHELGHKYAAAIQGFHSEFRAFPFLMLGSAVISFSGFVFVLFGGVFLECEKKDVIGKVAITGPLVNLAISLILIPLWWIDEPLVSLFAEVTIVINSLIAAINLIPCPPLDGFKVFLWNKTCWGISFLAALLMSMVWMGIYSFPDL